MELKSSRSPLFIISALVTAVIIMIASWWVYLLFFLSDRLMAIEGISGGTNFVRMIKWEGSVFILLLLVLAISLTILFFKDERKNRSIHAFFAGLTHELKTPLASIRLQSEVIKDEAERLDNERLDKLTDRLISDTAKLETQMDKILQLSRIERGGNLNLSACELSNFIKKIIYLHGSDLEVETENFGNVDILVDQFAIELILKNLLENTKIHSNSSKVKLTAFEEKERVIITYEDFGEFDGDVSKLGKLFYRHKSNKGSGIGLYLSKKLMKRMGGDMVITYAGHLVFSLSLKKSLGSEA